ncbi:MAG: HAD-IIA family hydrolase [Planctomycetaceae bacterium]|jgi:NagD protein|nr:HAD-IIA family hydrolase [Planctomycetaceae bacterium]
MNIDVLKRIRHIAFDMDGTIYSGKTLFPWTKEAFEIIEKLGIGYTYLTNNSSRSVRDYLTKIRALGLTAAEENVFSSASATLAYINEHYPAVQRIFLLGTESLKDEFRRAGYRILDSASTEEAEMVIAAFDTSLNYEDLCKTAWLVKQGLPYLATHPDRICPTDQPTVLVDCGAVTACIEAATGRKPDKVPGKPDKAMLDGICAKHALKPEEIAMVGDRLYTDMEMARAAGAVGVLVLSGEATREDLERSGLKPEFVADNILTFAKMLEHEFSLPQNPK